MSTQIPGIPQTASGTTLTNHINDRLRRISLVLGTAAAGTPGPAGAAGTPGTPGSGSGIYAAAFTIGVSGGAARPDLSRSPVQHVVLAATTNLVVPANRPASQTMLWLLYIDNPTGTEWALVPDGTYLTGAAIVVEPATRTILSCSTTQSGNTAVTNVLANQPIGTI